MRIQKVIATVMVGGLLFTVVSAETVELYEGKPTSEHAHSDYHYQQAREQNVVNAGSGDFRIIKTG